MYYLAKIYKDHTDNSWKANAIKYSDAYKNAKVIVQADKAIVAMLIFSDMNTAIVIKRDQLIKYG